MMKTLSKEEISQGLVQVRELGVLPSLIADNIEKRLSELELTEADFDKVVIDVIREYHRSLVEPGEAVGNVAAQSIGEPGTQMSLPGDEMVLVRRGSYSDVVGIGELVDELVHEFGSCEVEGSASSIVCDIPRACDISVASLGPEEKVHWKKLLQVSCHPPNGKLLRITTRTGRTIAATFSHSFVVRKNNGIVPIKGEDLKLGDRIPVVRNLPREEALDCIDLQMYLPKDEVWYGNELATAASLQSSWVSGYSQSYVVPVSIDGLRSALRHGKSGVLKPGYVYPQNYHNTRMEVPDKLELNSITGWFIGAYLSEGTNSGTFIAITNSEESFREKAIRFAELMRINYSVAESVGEYGPSTSVNIHSTLLAKLFARMCGKGSGGKFVPSWAINASESFVQGLLRGYFDGDGSVNVKKGMIRASSNSRELRDGICLLLSSVGILASKHRSKNQFSLVIPARYAPRFREYVGSDIGYIREALDRLASVEAERPGNSITYDLIDMIPGVGQLFDELSRILNVPSRLTRKFTKKQLIGRQTLQRYVSMFREKARKLNIDIGRQLRPLERALDSDIVWDEILRLQSIDCPTELVYDLSVSDLETFVTSEGLVTHNTLKTFHYAGVAELNVTLGLPRLIEIVDARKNPSTPMMTVYLEEDESTDPVKAREVAQRIELTRIDNIAQGIEVDLLNRAIVVRLDQDLMEDKGITPQLVVTKLKVLRKIELDLDEDKNIIYIRIQSEDFGDYQKLLERIRSTPIKGVKGVKRVMIRKEMTQSGKEEYLLYTEGTNLSQAIKIPGVDSTRTTSNNVHEIAETLGIEAARNALIREAQEVLGEQGLDVDVRHIMLVADLMTRTGEIRQIGRHGISGEKESVLARAAFEVTVKHLLDASVSGEEDLLTGITENVIVGQTIPLGTGFIDLYMSRSNKGK
jgi:DNA-directed RNA polymerase subunit A"